MTNQNKQEKFFQVVRMYRKGLITFEQAIGRILSLGFSQEEFEKELSK
jgi:hypothetical protein